MYTLIIIKISHPSKILFVKYNDDKFNIWWAKTNSTN